MDRRVKKNELSVGVGLHCCVWEERGGERFGSYGGRRRVEGRAKEEVTEKWQRRLRKPHEAPGDAFFGIFFLFFTCVHVSMLASSADPVSITWRW